MLKWKEYFFLFHSKEIFVASKTKNSFPLKEGLATFHSFHWLVCVIALSHSIRTCAGSAVSDTFLSCLLICPFPLIISCVRRKAGNVDVDL